MVAFVVRPVDGKMTLVPKHLAGEPSHARSDLATPNIVRAFSQPIQSMASGKWCDTPAELEATYKAANNPQGVDYVCVGNEDTTKFTPPKRDRKADREAISRAIADVESGNAPPVMSKLPA